MKRRQPPTLRRILCEFIALLILQAMLARALSHMSILDHLLSPGAESRLALGLTACFLLLRMFVLLFSPAWLCVRLWLWATRPKAG